MLRWNVVALAPLENCFGGMLSPLEVVQVALMEGDAVAEDY